MVQLVDAWSLLAAGALYVGGLAVPMVVFGGSLKDCLSAGELGAVSRSVWRLRLAMHLLALVCLILFFTVDNGAEWAQSMTAVSVTT